MRHLTTAALLTLHTFAAPAPAASSFPDPHHDHLGAVASESAPCSKIGISMLQQGGNAADAMVATVFCVGTIGMYHSGIGGGGFALVRAANGSYEMIDFREKAPAAASKLMYAGNYNGSIVGGLARYVEPIDAEITLTYTVAFPANCAG